LNNITESLVLFNIATLEDQRSSKKVSIFAINGDFSLKDFFSTNFSHLNQIEK
jgi:hypothetical protein